MRRNIGVLGFIFAAMAFGASPTMPQIANPMQFGSGNGAGEYHGYTSPIYIPYKHIKQTYRSQQRAAKQRRKSHKN